MLSGRGQEEIAAELGVAARTLRRWDHRERENRLEPRRRGRRPRRSTAEERNRLLGEIERHGPQIGVAPLRILFPQMGREEIRDILARYRDWYRREHQRFEEALQWTAPGLVWAMDHTEPPSPVDRSGRTVFSLRDLGSGAQLLWKAEEGPTARNVARDLEGLFALHGAPLVLKADNGSAFIAEEIQALVARWEVELLWSPPRRPRYNGSIEASIRWLKERTDHVARLAGRGGQWTAEDLRVALERTNTLPKDAEVDPEPRGEVFRRRERATDELRAQLKERLAYERAAERRLRRLAPGEGEERATRAEVNRKAMRRALVALGILTIKTRRVSPTLKSLFAA